MNKLTNQSNSTQDTEEGMMMQQQNQRAVSNDEPVMIAWKAYQQTDDYANSLLWSGKHSIGELWAAFSHGFAAKESPHE